VPEKHLLRSIDRFVELDGLRQELAPFYSEMGRPSIDPELLIRMLIVGYRRGPITGNTGNQPRSELSFRSARRKAVFPLNEAMSARRDPHPR
jgi:transposase